MASTRKNRITDGSTGALGDSAGAHPGGYFNSRRSLERNEGDFIDDTIAVWQKHTKCPLTREDGRAIIENMVGVFRVLREWNNADGAEQNKAKAFRAKKKPRRLS